MPAVARQDRSEWAIWLTGAICALAFLATIPLPRVDDQLIGSDGVRYYAVTRSLVIDGDLDFRNDYALLGEPIHITATGLADNAGGMGTSLLWLPFFLLAHGVSLALSAFGAGVPTNGTGYLYEAFVCLGTILYATIGLLLAYRTVRRVLEPSVSTALLATLAMWWATPMVYYVVIEPSMSHGITLFTMALFFHWWTKREGGDTAWRWVRLGLAVGLATLVRPQDLVIALVPAGELAWRVARRELQLTRALRYAVVFGVVALLTEVPQLVMWKILYGSPVTVPQGGEFMSWTRLHVFEVLFATRHGLLSWHPIFLVALLGLIPLWRRAPAVALAIAYVFLGELYVNSASTRWWADDAFGQRRFLSLVPMFAVTLTAAFDRWRPRWAPVALVAALTAWNGLCFLQYRLGFVAKHESLTLREMTIDRLLIPFQLVQRLLQ